MSVGSWIFVLAIVVVVVGGIVLGRQRLQQRTADTDRQARELAGGAAAVIVDDRAEFVGRASTGRGVRGSGTLLLTATDLVWVMGTPRRTWTVPRERIVGVRRPDEFLRMTADRPLLEVDHLDDAGAPDAAAWAVTDLDGWVAALGVPVEPA